MVLPTQPLGCRAGTPGPACCLGFPIRSHRLNSTGPRIEEKGLSLWVGKALPQQTHQFTVSQPALGGSWNRPGDKVPGGERPKATARSSDGQTRRPLPVHPTWAWGVTCVQVLQQGPKGHGVYLWAETAGREDQRQRPSTSPCCSSTPTPRQRQTRGCLRTTTLLPFHLVSSMLAK